jgi:hypothetical protein
MVNMAKTNGITKAIYVLSVLQIAAIMVAVASNIYLRTTHSPNHPIIPPETDVSLYLILFALLISVPNLALLIWEGAKEFKKKRFNKTMLGIALVVTVLWIVVLVFPSLTQPANCGCAPSKGI